MKILEPNNEKYTPAKNGGDVVNPRYFSKLKDFHRILAIPGTLEKSILTTL